MTIRVALLGLLLGGIGCEAEGGALAFRDGAAPCGTGICVCDDDCACPHQDPAHWEARTVDGELVAMQWRNTASGTARDDRLEHEICANVYNYGLRFEVSNDDEAIEHVRVSCEVPASAEDPACVFDGRATQGLFAKDTAYEPWRHVGLWIEGDGFPDAIADLVIEGLGFRGFRARGARVPSVDSVTAETYAELCPADPGLPASPGYIDDVDADGKIDIFNHAYCVAAYDRFTGAGVDATSNGPALTFRDCNFSFNGTGMLINAQNVLLDGVFAEYNEGTGIYIDHGSTAVLLANTVRQNGYEGAACQLGLDDNLACSDVGAMRPGIIVDGARAVIQGSWIHHNGTRGIELYRNVGEFGVTDPRAWVAAGYIEGNAIHHNGTTDGEHIEAFPVPSTTWSPPIGAGIAVGVRQGISYHAMVRDDGFSAGPSDRRAWIEPWQVDLELDNPAAFADPEHQNYNKRDYAVAEIVDNEIYSNYVGVYVASSMSAGAMVGFDYRDGADEALQHHRHSVSATRLKDNRFCDDPVDCEGQSDNLTQIPVFVGAPSVFENDEKYRFAGWDAFDKPVEVWGNNDFIGDSPNLRRDTHPKSDATDWDDDITGYYADQGYFAEQDWWQVMCNAAYGSAGASVGECSQALVRCWEDDDCPSDTVFTQWSCDGIAHNCTSQSWWWW